MGDDVRAQVAMDGDETPTRNLRRIADALGRPVSDFYGLSILDHEALTLLTLVQDYLVRVDLGARERFMRSLEAMDFQEPTA
ncbi:hypothetical protein MKK69_16275 [Methylobacterium sp. J-026]|uniref:hypothetical protein n=1 Tax=Methylobacterium sp. J-026 TaxID=2836624 RepID=UPI001FB8DBA5|nr:hypothetical protein [Methylobacterium sp. J-026]MCJ2135588.1 hypothetical protein [Methylobacterium sp. J-026]